LSDVDADVDVAANNAMQQPLCPTTSTDPAIPRTIELSKASSTNEDTMTATTPNRTTVTAVTDINVLIIVGLHAASINSELSEAVADCSADGITLTTVGSLTDLPCYSETFEHRGTPSSVRALRTAAAAADAVVIVTTYHERVPTVVNNAIDWLTRRWDQPALHDKPLAVIGRASDCYSGVWSHQTESADRIAGTRVIESITVSNLREAIKRLACEVRTTNGARGTIGAIHQRLR
jgi:NAD(P)H-dependent FMN reductase